MSNTADIETLEKAIENGNKYIELSTKLVELQKNPLYKEVIEEAYLTKTALDAVYAKTGVPKEQALVLKDIDDTLTGISAFKQWTKELLGVGTQLEDQVRQYETTLEELRQEDS